MPRKPKKGPEKFCLKCGTLLQRKRYNGRMEDMNRFLQRKFCSLHCANSRGIRSKKLGQQHTISQKLRKTHCEFCGRTPIRSQHLHAHHINGNWTDHRPENIQTLCVGCHLGLHKPKRKKCKICGEPAKGHGMCLKHYQRWKKYGDPLLTKKIGGSNSIIFRVGYKD